MYQDIYNCICWMTALQCTGALNHYNDAIMSAMASQTTSLMIVYSYIQAHINENIKAPRHWPLWEEILRWPVNCPHKGPVTRKNASVWWRHHDNGNYVIHELLHISWWRHQMETFSALLVLCAENSLASGAELWCFLWSAPVLTVE